MEDVENHVSFLKSDLKIVMIKKRMEVKPAMLYCPKCQVLVKTGTVCPSCGGKKLREVRPNDPVLLYTAEEFKCNMIRAAFDSDGIPHEERMCGPGAPSSILYGKAPYSEYHIFVPFCQVGRCEEILRGIGALTDSGGEAGLSEQEQPAKSTVSRRRILFFRMMAAILFLGLIAAAVSLADTVVDFLKSAFH